MCECGAELGRSVHQHQDMQCEIFKHSTFKMDAFVKDGRLFRPQKDCKSALILNICLGVAAGGWRKEKRAV